MLWAVKPWSSSHVKLAFSPLRPFLFQSYDCLKFRFKIENYERNLRHGTHGNFPGGYVLMWIENVTQSQVSPVPFRTTKALYLKFLYVYLLISKVYNDSYSYLKESNKSQRITTSVDLRSIADRRNSFNSIAGRNQTLEAFCGRFTTVTWVST